jgi:hypothetical protein
MTDSQPIRLPIGISDFRKLREEGFYYVDKTAMVDVVVASNAEVLLAPRPRRFGKTLNLSMLRYFFEKSAEDRSPLFAGLAVASSEIARPHFQRYPTIFITFKDVKATSWDDCIIGIQNVLAEAFGEHAYLQQQTSLAPEDLELFRAIRSRKASAADCKMALRLLSRLLAQHHGERVVILVDEYDTPIHAAYTNRYYDEAIAFFRDFLSSGLKDNSHLFRGVLTGILRVARESVFSGLNNLVVYSLLRSELAPYFGFTEPEVEALARAAGAEDRLADLRAWYNGYLFGGQVIYNPWSVLSFLSSADRVFRPYWVATSSNDLVRDLLVNGPGGARVELESLLAGGTIDKRVVENVALRDLEVRPDAVWSLLLFSGYLKAVETYIQDHAEWVKLAIPNQEVALELSDMVRAWMEQRAGSADDVERMLRALLGGDARTVERYLSRMMKASISYFDTAGPEPERFYHGLVVGLLASLGSRYEVRSNRESGFGRVDVMVLPRAAGQPGVVLELKTVDVDEGETPEAALGAALSQIEERDYAAELRERGAAPIWQMAAVFDGKRADVRVGG